MPLYLSSYRCIPLALHVIDILFLQKVVGIAIIIVAEVKGDFRKNIINKQIFFWKLQGFIENGCSNQQKKTNKA